MQQNGCRKILGRRDICSGKCRFQGICNILQDASRFQHGIQLHIYSVERHVKPFYFKKIKDLRVKINVSRFTQSWMDMLSGIAQLFNFYHVYRKYKKKQYDFISWFSRLLFESREVFQITTVSLSVLIGLGLSCLSVFLKSLSSLNGPQANL